ncbi:MAG: hypothetical protein ACOX23_00525 [Peptococcia bacterium]
MKAIPFFPFFFFTFLRF